MEIKDLIREQILSEIIIERDRMILDLNEKIVELENKIFELEKKNEKY